MHPPNHKKGHIFFSSCNADLASSKFSWGHNTEMRDGENVLFLKSYLPVRAGYSPDQM